MISVTDEVVKSPFMALQNSKRLFPPKRQGEKKGRREVFGELHRTSYFLEFPDFSNHPLLSEVNREAFWVEPRTLESLRWKQLRKRGCSRALGDLLKEREHCNVSVHFGKFSFHRVLHELSGREKGRGL